MELKLYQVDAFSSRVFGGNPAAVCPLERWLPDDLMQKIALENNLSETAFFVPNAKGYELRWFTPTLEVDLCGHATLASAYVIFEQLGSRQDMLSFSSKSGELRVTREGSRFVLDFPARPSTACDPPDGFLETLMGPAPTEVLGPRWLIVYEDEAAIRSLAPDFRALKEFGNAIVTAPGTDVDFVTRYFAPCSGIDEDPVTGSAHCTSAPYWAKRLGKSELSARQVSARGGDVFCVDRGERVSIAGECALYMSGSIQVDPA